MPNLKLKIGFGRCGTLAGDAARSPDLADIGLSPGVAIVPASG
jgi:hypothetical protein